MVVLNYTYLHAFTRFYTKFLAGNVNAGNGVLESWSNGLPEGWGGQKRARSYWKWEKVGMRRGKRPVFPAFSHHFPAFPGISHLFPLKFLKAMNKHDIPVGPTPCPLPRVGTRGWGGDCWAILPRVAPKQHGATTGLNAATSL